ncbi:hypothetical protein [Parachlamydia acanthamoebae]|jgi:hypothetical protein|uniref:hypothetical protein n=1 Tax=Parachlamydia acanthamoebae TaxID=83552 RepID=UPI0024E1F58A|nr:hypothetical protein [Parachlamydia acanthamoebae]
MRYFLFALFLFLNFQILIAEDCQFNTVIELCFGKIESAEDPDDIFAKCRPKHIERETVGNAGFIAGCAALGTYKTDVQRALLIKEAMCRCVVSQEFTCDQLKIADDVIRESKNPLSVGIAWYRKSLISYFKSNYEMTLIYSEIALQTLKKAGEESSKDDGVSDKIFFESLCHAIRKSTYDEIRDRDNYEKEKNFKKL